MVTMNAEQLIGLFQTAGQIARFSHQDMAEAMRELYGRRDHVGVQSLFEAYKRWNLLSTEDPYATEVALENLDTYAYTADLTLQNVPDGELVRMAIAFSQEPVAPIGEVRAFYRAAVRFVNNHPNYQ